jgi:hypothetical protein
MRGFRRMSSLFGLAHLDDPGAALTVEPVGGAPVIGRKKLSTIRHELQGALNATGDDPIRWLDERMAACGRQGPAAARESEVLRSLRRFLEASGREKGGKQRHGAKK